MLVRLVTGGVVTNGGVVERASRSRFLQLHTCVFVAEFVRILAAY